MFFYLGPVSYTHLSQAQQLLQKKPKVSGGQVYMSQALNQVLLAGEDEMKAMGDEYVSVEHLFLAMIKKPNNAVKELFRGYGTVSYTHLDVYKRQRQYRSAQERNLPMERSGRQ